MDEHTKTSALADRVVVHISNSIPIPRGTRREVKSRARRLRERLPAFDRELGVRFPVVDVVPVLFYTNIGGIVRGRMAYKQYHDGVLMVVQLCAPTLLVFDEHLVDGVLAHEFLHYVWECVRIINSMDERGTARLGPVDARYLRGWDPYREIDRAMQVHPTDWLSPRLADLARRVEEARGPEFLRADKLVRERWIDPGYPSEMVDRLDDSISGDIVVDEEVIQKASVLGLLTRNLPT